MPLNPLPALIGHRCARAHAPENTVIGLQTAHRLGVTWVEVDVRLTRDGVPVLLHDDTLERTSNGQGTLADLTLEDVQRLDAGSWFGTAYRHEPIPTLGLFLQTAAALGIGVNLELKGNPGDPIAIATAALTVARAAWPNTGPPLLVSSFETPCLEAALRLVPDWPRGLLLDTLDSDGLAEADRIDAAAIIVNHLRITSPTVTQALSQGGRMVLAYTVNDPVRAHTLYRWGVTSVITDRPDHIMQEAAGPTFFAPTEDDDIAYEKKSS